MGGRGELTSLRIDDDNNNSCHRHCCVDVLSAAKNVRSETDIADLRTITETMIDVHPSF